jgi:vitamin B12 transporter
MKSLLLASALFAPVAAFAQAAATATLLDPVIVSATGSETGALQVATNVLVITREQIEAARANDLADLLRPYAGLEVERSGGPGQLSFVRIRGGEADHTLILIDGVRSNSATSAPVLEHLDPQQIERIEIIKGPRSTLYGADAVAGVINIITRKATTSGFSLSGMAGTHNSRDLAAGLDFADAGKQLSANVSRSESDGIPICAAGGPNSGYDRTSVGLNGSVRAGITTLGVRAMDTRGTTQYVDFCGAGGNNPLDQAFKQQTVAAEFGIAPAGIWSLRAVASRIEDDLQQRQSADFVNTVRPQIDVVNRLDFGADVLSLTLSAAREKTDILSYGSTIDETRDLYAVRLQNELNLDRHKLLLGVAYDDQDSFGSKITWNAEYSISLWKGGEVIAATGSGFRAPSVFERSGFGGNPNLKAEYAKNYEAGLRQRLGSSQVLDLRAFRTDVDDLIAYIGSQNQNVSEYRNQGLDLSYRIELEHWSAILTGLIQNPEDRMTGQALTRRAKRNAGLKVLRRFDRGSLGIDVSTTSARPDTDFSTFTAVPVQVGGYGLVNLSGSLKLSREWTLRAKIDNVLDKDYQTVFGYRQDGAAVHVGLSYSQ